MVSISGPAWVNEASSTATYIINVTSPSTSATVIAGYKTVHGTAISGQDFTGASTTAIVTTENATTTITIAITNDAIDESDENFSVTLTSSDYGTLDTRRGRSSPTPRIENSRQTLARVSGFVTCSVPPFVTLCRSCSTKKSALIPRAASLVAVASTVSPYSGIRSGIVSTPEMVVGGHAAAVNPDSSLAVPQRLPCDLERGKTSHPHPATALRPPQLP